MGFPMSEWNFTLLSRVGFTLVISEDYSRKKLSFSLLSYFVLTALDLELWVRFAYLKLMNFQSGKISLQEIATQKLFAYFLKDLQPI